MGNKRRVARFAFIGMVIAGLGFLYGVLYERETAEPVIRTVVEEVTVEVPLELRDFESRQELGKWLHEREKNRIVSFVGSGYDCDNAARAMVEDAVDDGYWMWVQIVDDPLESPLSGETINKAGDAHALTSVIIGNGIYYIEPALGEYWLAYFVD